MLTHEQISKLGELDRIMEVCHTEEGKHLLEELKKLDFYKTLQTAPTDSVATGPLSFLANMANDATNRAHSVESQLFSTQQALKDIVKMMEEQIYNKGDNSPSENTTLQEINQIRSRNSFLY